MEPQLLIALIVGIALIVVIVLKTRLDAFAALLMASIAVGLIAGQDLVGIVESIKTGFGNTLASIGIVIGLGVAMGKLLEVSGGASAMAQAFLRAFGKGREVWAMSSIGAIISIPVFADSGYVIMNPLARAIARIKGHGYVALGLSLAAGMVLTHHFVPPTPGPLGVAGILGVDVGQVIIAGTVMTVFLLPVGTAYAMWVGPKLDPHVSPQVKEDVYGGQALREHASGQGDSSSSTDQDELGERPAGAAPHRVGAVKALLPLIVPILLIVLNTALVAVDKNAQGALTGDYEPSSWVSPFIFIGDPIVALLVGLLLSAYLLLPRWAPRNKVHNWLAEAAASAGLILLITGAGGGLGQVLRDTGIGDALAQAVAGLPLPSFLLPFIIATIVRLAQGSGTVAMITAASVTAPVVAAVGLTPVVGVMACVAGAMIASYYNDSFFWVVTRFLGLDGVAALRSHTMSTTVMWAASIPLLWVMSIVV